MQWYTCVPQSRPPALWHKRKRREGQVGLTGENRQHEGCLHVYRDNQAEIVHNLGGIGYS